MDFEKLFHRLYEKQHDPNPRGFGDYYLPREGEKLTEGEWVDLVNFIKGPPRVPVTIGHGAWGFNINLRLWSPRLEPYPGAVIPAKQLIAIAPQHHPSYDFNKNRLLLYPKDGSTSSWDVFAPLVEDPENVRLLEACGMDAPKEKHHYAY